MKYTRIIPDITENYLENLLKIRGIEDISHYIKPTIECELDPILLTNMAKAVEIVDKHIDGKIGLIVDSDCDGFTSAAIIYQYLKDVNPNIDITYYLHEGKGHGLEDIIDDIDLSLNLLIIPDASSNDYELHENLAYNGIDIVVLDHHEAEHYSANAYIVNNQLCEKYGNKELTGAGVAYKFCEMYDELRQHNFAHKYIDLAAVGIVGDMSDIRHLETRYIIQEGLSHIENPFLLALIEKQAYSIGNNPITPTTISFYIVPLINALIRVGKQSEKDIMFQAFVKGTTMVQSTKRGAKQGDWESIAQQAARTCVNARSRQNRQKEKAIDNLDMNIIKNGLNENKIIIVPVEDETIDTTLTGLIAMQLVSKYKRPVLVGRETKDGFLKGSTRAPDKTELTDARQFLLNSGYFEYAEGHAQAHGFSIPLKNIEAFTKYANEELANINFNEGVYQVDFIKTVDSDIYNLIMEMGSNANLWAKGNEEPYIVITDITLNQSDLQIMGAGKDSVKFNVKGVDFVKFKDIDFIEKLQNTKEIKLTIIGRANINNFMGNISPQLFIEDYELVDNFYEF